MLVSCDICNSTLRLIYRNCLINWYKEKFRTSWEFFKYCSSFSCEWCAVNGTLNIFHRKEGSENCRTNWAFWIISSVLFCTDVWSSVLYWLLLVLEFLSIISVCVSSFLPHSPPRHIAVLSPATLQLLCSTSDLSFDCCRVSPPSGFFLRQQANWDSPGSACSLWGRWGPGSCAGRWQCRWINQEPLYLLALMKRPTESWVCLALWSIWFNKRVAF